MAVHDEETQQRPSSPLPPRLFSWCSLAGWSRQLKGPRAITFALALLLALFYLSSSRAPPTRPNLGGYTSLAPHDAVHISDEELLRLEAVYLQNGSRYDHPLPSSWPNPWPKNSRIAQELLSPLRFPPPAGSIGVDADARDVTARRKQVGLGTKPPPAAFEVPHSALQDAYQYRARVVRGWEEQGLNRGEGFNNSDGRPLRVPREVQYDGKKDGWKPLKLGVAKDLPDVQKSRTDTRTEEHKVEDSQRREWVRRAFLHLWESYKANSWGHDEVRPLSGGSTDSFNGWSATIFDCLDTLLIMGLEEEYQHAREHVALVDFAYLSPRTPDTYPPPSQANLPRSSPLKPTTRLHPLPSNLVSPVGVPTFETVIRYLGGLISAFDLSNDPLMLARAVDLADWLLPCFTTESALLIPTCRFGSHSDGGPSGKVVLAEVGSTTLEFTRLYQLTGDVKYFEVVSRTTDRLDNWHARERLPHLFPTEINPDEPRYLPGVYSFGGQADSYYEYLIKEHQLLGGASSQYPRMYANAIDSALEHLVRPLGVTGMDLITIGDMHFSEVHNQEFVDWYSTRVDHLTCFAGGMLGLGSRLLNRPRDLDTAIKFTDTCIWAYDSTRSGLAPETMEMWSEQDLRRWEVVELSDGTKVRAVKGDPPGRHSGSNYHIQRPETVESLWYLYRLTGDRRYQDKAWRFFTSWVSATIVDGGFAHLDNVNSPSPTHDDSGVESFVYGETLKYYFLLFSSPDVLTLDDWVFTTEAHPLRIPKPNSGNNKAPFWAGPSLRMPSTPIGEGSPHQKWARVQQYAAARGGR